MSFLLEIDQILYSFSHEDMVTSPAPFLETKPGQQVPQIIKTDVCICPSAKDPFKKLPVNRHKISNYHDLKRCSSALLTIIVARYVEKVKNDLPTSTLASLELPVDSYELRSIAWSF